MLGEPVPTGPERRSWRTGKGVRYLTGSLSTLAAAVLGFALLDVAYLALVIVVGLAVVTAPVTWWRLRHRTPGRRAWQRVLTTAPFLLLLPHLPLTAPDLAQDVAPVGLLIGIPAVCCVLLAARALLLPAASLPVARSTMATIVSLGLAANLLTYYDLIPSGNDAVQVHMPMDGEWFALQAGRSLLTNHHVLAGDQGHAVDFVRRLPGGTTSSGPTTSLSSYAAYGQVLRSPVAGRVVAVERGLPDQRIGSSDTSALSGNNVVIQVKAAAFVQLAHMRSDSVRAEVGDLVRVGDVVGEVGNSGNTTEPHLHLQAMTSLVDGRPLRLEFIDVSVRRGGQTLQQQSVEVRRNDRVRARGSGSAGGASPAQ